MSPAEASAGSQAGLWPEQSRWGRQSTGPAVDWGGGGGETRGSKGRVPDSGLSHGGDAGGIS